VIRWRRASTAFTLAWILGPTSPVDGCSALADPWFFRTIRIEAGPDLAGIHIEESGAGAHIRNNTARSWEMAPLDRPGWTFMVPAKASVLLPMQRLQGLNPGFGLDVWYADGRPTMYEAPPTISIKLLARAGSESHVLELISSYVSNPTYNPTRWADGMAACAAFMAEQARRYAAPASPAATERPAATAAGVPLPRRRYAAPASAAATERPAATAAGVPQQRPVSAPPAGPTTERPSIRPGTFAMGFVMAAALCFLAVGVYRRLR